MTTEFKVTVKVEAGEKHKTYQLKQTAKATKSEKTGKMSLAHFQPAESNIVLKPFGKIYVDTVEFSKKDKS